MKAQSISTTATSIKRLRSRLARWELPHLRKLAARLHEQLEEVERRAASAERCAEMWQSLAEQLQDDMRATGEPATVALTMQGDLILVNGGAQ